MNKVLILVITNVLLLALSCYLGYELYKKPNIQNNGITTRIPPEANCTSYTYDYSNKPWTGQIDARLAKVMAENYKNDKQKSLIYIDGSEIHDSDARSVWFPLESLKSYIWDVEKQSCSNNCNSEQLGLRIYFAKYPDKSSQFWSWPGLWEVKSEYENRHTIFMIPTYRNGGNDNDFDPWSGCNKVVTPGTINNPADTINSVKSKYVYYFALSETGQDGKNHGTLIPPGDPTGTSF